MKACFSNAGLQSTWCKLGKDTAELWGSLLGVDVTWFDGELSATKQRKAIDNMATQEWDFVAIQAFILLGAKEHFPRVLSEQLTADASDPGSCLSRAFEITE